MAITLLLNELVSNRRYLMKLHSYQD